MTSQIIIECALFRDIHTGMNFVWFETYKIYLIYTKYVDIHHMLCGDCLHKSTSGSQHRPQQQEIAKNRSFSGPPIKFSENEIFLKLETLMLISLKL